MRSNLHIHSRYSDGTQWPDEIVAAAKACGIEQVALTDHDSMEGVPEFMRACAENGLRGVAGAEIDCRDDAVGQGLELLAFFPSGEFAKTRSLLRARLEDRRRTAQAYLRERFSIGLDELERLRLGGRPAEGGVPLLTYLRPHLFHYLRSKGLIPGSSTYPDFKKEHHARTGLRLSMAEVVAAVREDRGLLVAAHPGYLFPGGPAEMLARPDALTEKLSRLKSAGVRGVELYYYDEAAGGSDELNALARRVAERLGLLLTSGSDHHGPPRDDGAFGSPRDTLGLFIGEVDTL